MKLKSLVIAVAAATAVVASANVFAAHGMYVRLGGGVNFASKLDFGTGLQYDMKTGYNFTGSFGLNSGALGYEAELGYLHNKFKNGQSGSLGTTVALVNVLYNFEDINPTFIPYVGVGVGSATADFDGNANITGKETKLAYQALVGVNYKLNQQALLGLSYNFIGTGKYNVAGASKKDAAYNHGVNLNLVYNF